MSVPKAKALLTVCAALLLCGCGQALSEREIVRAVFFARQQGAYSACLLLADQNAESDGVQYKTASARGNTAAQALHLAEDALPGRLYYGLLDLAALPPGCDWADAQTLGTLLYDKAQPAPELSVFVLDTADHSWAADAASLYEDMKAVEMTAMGEQVEVSDTQMQFLQKKALIQRSHRRISNNGRQNSHQKQQDARRYIQRREVFHST